MNVKVGIISFHRIRVQKSLHLLRMQSLGCSLEAFIHCSILMLGLLSHTRIPTPPKLSANVELRYEKDGKALPQANQTRNH